MCGVQSGKTEWMVVDALALVSLGISYQLVQPKDDLRVLFCRTRIDDQLKRCQFYDSHVSSVGKIYKWIGTGIFRIVFSNREDEMIAFPADAIGVDEVDRCDLNNLSLLPDRLLGSDFALFRRSSTPTTQGNESIQNISWHYDQGDKRKYFVPCEHCGFKQEIDWFKTIVQEKRDSSGKLGDYELRDKDWKPELDRDIYPICIQCGLSLNRLAKGTYYPTVETPQVVKRKSYNFGKLLSPLVTMRGLWEDYGLSIHNPFKLQRFFNSILGTSFIGEGTKVTTQMLYSCIRNYILQGNLDKCEFDCSMGVDVGPEWLDVRISSYPYEGQQIRKAVFISKLKTFEELYPLIDRFNVNTCVIDAEPETRQALIFQQGANCAVYVCYSREKSGMILSDLLLEKVKLERRMTIDRTLMMDCVLETFIKKEQELPKNIAFLSEQRYVLEMTNPTRVLDVDDKGKEKFVWTRGADHSFMADMYDYCAMILGGLSSRYHHEASSKRVPVVATGKMDWDVEGMMA